MISIQAEVMCRMKTKKSFDKKNNNLEFVDIKDKVDPNNLTYSFGIKGNKFWKLSNAIEII